MSAVPPTPPLVLDIAQRGPFAEFVMEGTRWAMDEGGALLRHYVDLLRQKTPEANDALAELHQAVCDAGLKRHIPEDAPIACKKGCAHCCYQHVSITAVEVFHIARHIRATPDPDAVMAKLEAKLANRDWDPTRDYDPRNPCAFLDLGGACSIHAFRPMVCRIVMSLSVADCIRNLADGAGAITMPRANFAIRGWLTPAMLSALQAAGYPTREYELCGAVRAVLADPGIEARWYAGHDGLEPFSSDAETADATMLAEISQWRAMAGV